MADDPIRWIEDPKASSELRKAMACAVSASRAPSDMSAALDKLRAKLTEQSTERQGRALGAKAGWIVLGGAFVVGGIATFSRSDPPTRPVAVPTAVEPAPALSAESASVPRELERELVAPPASIPARPAREPSAPARSPRMAPVTVGGTSPAAKPHAGADAPAPPADETDELARLALARRHLRTDPAQALRLLTELDRTHPRGILLEERGALAIDALVREGRLDEARARARHFLRTYSRSPYADQVSRSTGLSATGVDDIGDGEVAPH